MVSRQCCFVRVIHNRKLIIFGWIVDLMEQELWTVSSLCFVVFYRPDKEFHLLAAALCVILYVFKRQKWSGFSSLISNNNTSLLHSLQDAELAARILLDQGQVKEKKYINTYSLSLFWLTDWRCLELHDMGNKQPDEQLGRTFLKTFRWRFSAVQVVVNPGAVS